MLHRYTQLFPSHPFPNQLTVNNYEPGDGIGPHLDSPDVFETGPILILSLESDIVMDFLLNEHSIHVELKRRSVIILMNQARLEWKHAIRPRKVDNLNGIIRERSHRISFTFRRVRQES
jgi:alkylated DNA repair protein alkB family protein 8